MRLQGKVAVVTGAGTGIGQAIAVAFAQSGAAVVVDYVGKASVSEDTIDKINAMSGKVLGVDADISLPDDVDELVQKTVAAFGKLDIFVNNAGIEKKIAFVDYPLEEWQKIVAVNLTGPFLCARAAVPLMRDHGGGAIVNITSISAVRASTLRSAYGTSKAGLAHLTKQLAVELASLGIRVNGVAPGPVETAMAKQVHTPEIRADYHDAIPLNRYGLEAELAEAVFFLCSDRASYITGQILAVDGGFDAAGIGLPTLRGERRNG